MKSSTLKDVFPESSSINALDAKEKKHYNKCKLYLKQICQLKKKIQYMKNKDYLKELSNDNAIKKISKYISPNFAILLHGQVRNFKKKVGARRWTSEDKILALRIYKRSPTCFRLLRRMFCLPTASTLKALLRKCQLKVGVK